MAEYILRYMKLIKSKNIFILGIILIIALFVRIYRLNSIPYGFHNDEAKAAWNAYSILKTGADDKGNVLPMYYDSFGDFRPSGLIYLIIPFLMIFGNTIFAVRFPFALIGAFTVFPIFYIVKKLSKSSNIALLSTLIISLNPWHIIASRATSESVVSIFFTLWGIYFLIKSLKKPRFKNIFLSIVFFVLSYFFYHNIRVLAPILVFIIIFFSLIFEDKKPINLKPFIIFVALIFSSILFFSSKEARGRMSQVSIRSDFRILYETTKMPNEEGPGHVLEARIFHNKIASLLRCFAEEYKGYFGTDFLVGNTAKPIRYTVPQVGLLTYFEFLLVVFGLFWVSKRRELLVVVALLAVAPLPGAVTIEDTPNLQRAIYMLPFLSILAAYGFYGLINLPKKFKIIPILIFFGYVVNFIYFAHMYFIHQKMSLATYYRDGGNVELAYKIDNLSTKYDEIVLTNSPDDLYPWLAFLNKYEPVTFNKSYKDMINGSRKYKNIIFSADKCPLNSALEKNLDSIESKLFVDAEGCVVESKFDPVVKVSLIETILRPDGSPPYYLRTVKLIK